MARGDLLKALKSAAGKALDFKAASDVSTVKGWLHTGNYALNWAISDRLLRGWPLGFSAEIFGDSQTGKSYLIYRAIAEAIAQGGEPTLDDVEHAFHHQWAERHLGIVAEDLAYRHPSSKTIEEHTQLIKVWLAALADRIKKKKSAGPFIMATDSLALLSTEHALSDKSTRDMTRARLFHELYRVLNTDLNEYPALYLAANHKISSMDQWSPDESTGGRGPKYSATVRLDLRQPKRIKGGPKDVDEYVGVISRILVVKNRLTLPWREVRMTIPFKQAINPYSGLIPVLLRIGVVETTSGHTLAYQGEDTKIKAYVSDEYFLAQDRSAIELVNKHPDILEVADGLLKERDEQENYMNVEPVEE